jgi:peptide deformylase
MEIQIEPNPILRKVCSPVTDFSEAGRILKELEQTLDEDGTGVGIAAPQIGYSLRIFLVKFSGYCLKAINPKITKSSGEIVFGEGCLSVPDRSGNVKRARKITLEYYDEYGKFHCDKFENFVAVVIQHEYDHLDGILFTDKLYEN